MSLELTILTALVAFLALLAVIKPKMLFEYPIAGSVLMWFFIIPQAWKIEASGDLNDFEPTLAWGYMILCMVATFIGFKVGTSRAVGSSKNSLQQIEAQYDLRKLLIGASTLVAIGEAASLLISRELATMEAHQAWTGAIAFYAMVSILLLYGTSLCWVFYLYTKSRIALLISIFGLCVTLPNIIFGARRESSFAVVAVFLLGLFFVKNKSISRIILFPLIFIGSILINQAGAIRSYMENNNTTIIGAMTADEIVDRKDTDKDFSEMASGVSDIAIATWSNQYDFQVPFYNGLVSLYVPAFIVGRDVKDFLKINQDDDGSETIARFERGGATRTGFSDSFQSLHYFGCLIFFAIAYLMGNLWVKAKGGDIKAQLYYMTLLSAGLKVFTESTSVFLGILPLIFISLGGVFWYARRRTPGNSANSPLRALASKEMA